MFKATTVSSAALLAIVVGCSVESGNLPGSGTGASKGVTSGSQTGSTNSGNGTSAGGTHGTSASNAGSGNGSGATGSSSSPACGEATCFPDKCGTIVDDCGNSIDCGTIYCPLDRCGTSTPNVCAPCEPITDCAKVGKNCGPIPDGCGGIIQCGDCTAPQCCGCGGVPSVCGGSGTSTSSTLSVASTCIVGSKGCLCDSRGACAPGLTCTPQTAPKPNLCCNGSDCATATTSIGSSCAATGAATCTPGISLPSATDALDSCGYPASSFNESIILCAINATGGGRDPAQIQVFYNDEHAMPLGCATSSYQVSALPSNPGAVYYPQTGDPNCADTQGRPMRPVLYVTDITGDPNCRAGDQQRGGKAYDPIAVFGTWKSAGSDGTPNSDPDSMNLWNLGTAADPVVADATKNCPCTAGSCSTRGHTGRGFGTEVRFEAGLISGHSYRLQVMMHDGDQTQGADSGEACAIFCAGTGSCTPLTCADYPGSCGQQPDGCGGLTPECAPCTIRV